MDEEDGDLEVDVEAELPQPPAARATTAAALKALRRTITAD
jgi:hypothetical protein